MREPSDVSGDGKVTERDGGVEELEDTELMLYGHTVEWSVAAPRSVNDSEPEDLLKAINPNHMYTSAPSESDSDHSEPALYQVVYDISAVGGAEQDVISIELDQWSSHVLLPESCVVNELLKMEEPLTSDPACMVYPDLQLTDEEQKLLDQEGISLPSNLPLTKAEERILKKVRRKIRNKLSAQDSRRRKKEYVDGLENRVAACSAQNKELLRTVDQLEKHNLSLVAQLQKLQALIKQTATKAAQTSTCIMILLFSLALLIFPSYSPFGRGSVALEESYAPSAVVSRNILSDVGSPAGADLLLSEALPMEHKPSDVDPEPAAPQNTEPELRNATAPARADADTDAAKPPHADEM